MIKLELSEKDFEEIVNCVDYVKNDIDYETHAHDLKGKYTKLSIKLLNKYKKFKGINKFNKHFMKNLFDIHITYRIYTNKEIKYHLTFTFEMPILHKFKNPDIKGVYPFVRKMTIHNIGGYPKSLSYDEVLYKSMLKINKEYKRIIDQGYWETQGVKYKIDKKRLKDFNIHKGWE